MKKLKSVVLSVSLALSSLAFGTNWQVVYETDFSSDPGWTTNNSSHYYWDSSDQTYYIYHINIDYGGEYAYYDTGYSGGSFRLEWDVNMLLSSYATGIAFGLFDTGLYCHHLGNHAWVSFVTEDKGHMLHMGWIDSSGVEQYLLSTWQFSCNTWYHVILEYDAGPRTLTSTVTLRETGQELCSLIATDVGPFAADMDRVGTSNLRDGPYQVPGACSIGKVDNVIYSASEPPGPVIYVDKDAPGANNGSSWDDAFNYLQDALAVARCGDEIRLAAGIYKPDEDTDHPDGTGYRTATFQLINGVAINGGYAGFGEPDPDARDFALYETILSGDLAENDGLDFANNGENSLHVVTGSGTDETAVLDGFIITGGNANAGLDNYGGGMGNYNFAPATGPTVVNCEFYRNCAVDGAGLVTYNSDCAISNCTFIENRTVAGTGSGAGVYNAYNSSTFVNCGFYRNVNTGGGGGGMCNFRCSSTFTNCVFIENSAGNSTYGCGGGMYNQLEGTNLTLTNCMFIGNSAYKSGGGIHNENSAILTLTNCIFTGNSSPIYGGGMHNNKSRPTLSNCTFSANWAPSGRALACGSYINSPGGPRGPSDVRMVNCIFWDGGNEIYNDNDSTITITYSDVQGGHVGMGNIDGDPLFVDADGPDNIVGTEDDDLHLCSGSLCIDAGDNSAVPPDLTEDLDGNPRIFRAAVDMGAYEYQNTAPVANAGGPYIAQATSWHGALVALDGTGSYDPDGDTITYEWDLDLSVDSDEDGDPTNDVDATEPILSQTFRIGQTEISLVVTDECGVRSEPDITTVTVSVIEAGIDIKPGSFPNSINMGSHGVVPVAFLTTLDFDASTIDAATVTLRGEDFADGLVKLRGKKDAPVPMSDLEDVDSDGDLDLVVHLETEKLAEYELEAICEIGALTYDGYVVSGCDTIQIVPE